jgi:hypothetical protein
MSEPSDLTLDLESAFLPSWAQKPIDPNRYANHPGDSGESARDRRGGPFGARPFGDRPDRRGPRPGGPGGPGAGPGGGFNRGPRAPGGDRRVGPGGPGGPGLKWDPAQGGERRPFRGDRRPGRFDRPPEPPPIPLDVDIKPDAGGVASLARQIRMSGRSYPLLDVANLVMQKPDRYEVTFRVRKDKDGKPEQPLWVCSLDDSVWLSEGDAIRHALTAHFDTFYKAERQPCDPPKGVWTLVAIYDNEVLGPPNYHGYQEKLRELWQRRGGRLSFDDFKARVRVVKDEAAVKSWIEGQSFKTQYTTLNTPEPLTLGARAEVEAHFREVHAGVVAKSVDYWKLVRAANLPPLPDPLHRLLRGTLDRESRFPIRMMTALSSDFAHAGLQFFKLNKNAVHVSVARPRHLDVEKEPVSALVKAIIDFIQGHPGTNRRKLVEALAPAPAPTPVVAEVAAAETVPAVAEASSAAVASETAPTAEAAPAAPVPSDAERQLLADLHWLVHQGHVIEFANGLLELARKPAPRPEAPPKPQKQPRPERPEGPRRSHGRRVSDNLGLLPVPAPNAALVGL